MILDNEALNLGEKLPKRIIKYFSEVMKEAREQKGITIEQLAALIGKDVNTIEQLESGEIDKLNNVSADIMFIVADKLDIDFGKTFIDVKRKAMKELKN